jgi:hypothetical protein
VLPGGGFGRVRDASGDIERYLAHLLSTLPGPVPVTRCRLPGCGSSSTARTAPHLSWRRGCFAARAPM